MPKTLEIQILDIIGPDFFGEGITAKDVLRQINEAEEFDEILVRINSPGGSAWDGIGIYNLLADRDEKVITRCEGIALSAASIILMAGDERQIAENARVMIHDASNITWGNAEDHAHVSEVLDQLDGLIALTYAKRADGEEQTFREAMDKETWYTAAEAKAAGLVDTVISAKSPSAGVDPQNSYDLSRFRHVPKEVQRQYGKQSGNTYAIVCGPPPRDEIEKLFPQSERSETTPMSKDTQQQQPPAPETNQPTPPAEKPVDVEAVKKQAAEEARQAERDRHTKIQAACSAAGMPQAKIDEMLQGDTTVEDAKDQAFNYMVKNRQPVGEEDNHDGAPPSGKKKDDDPDAALKQEYAANPHYAACGMSEQDYIDQKKRDANGGQIVPKFLADAMA